MNEQNRDPYCGIIPSPDQLDRNINSPGLDVIQTRRDFNHVWGWLSTFSNIGFYRDVKTTVDRDEQLEPSVFKSVIRSAFQAFDPIRNTYSREAEEMVLLYYTGHGLSEEGATRLNEEIPDESSSSPLLEKVGYTNPGERFSAAQPHLTPNRNVKGGELCLHEVGFCDLQGLLEPWIAAVKVESHNRRGEKKNKHVVIIADSCYSGKLVEDLARLNQWPGPWNKNDCTVTVQSACNSHEVTFGGYFTPCFVYYNQTGGLVQQIQGNAQQMSENDQQIQENAQQIQESVQQIQENDQHISELDGLIREWNGKIEIEKDAYRKIELPSPQLATTRLPGNVDSENDPVLKLSLQGFQMYLFRDAGFFKFCYLKYSGALRPSLALDGGAVQTFLERDWFDIIDYKLTKMGNGTPIALFLIDNPDDQDQVDNPGDQDQVDNPGDPDQVDNPGDQNHVICVRIHFSNSTTAFANISEVNLVQHQCPTYPSLLFLAVNNSNAVRRLNHKEHATQYEKLVTQCKNYVEASEPGRWVDVTRWNMGNNQLGVNHMIRMRDRSTWMNKYVEDKIVAANSQT